MRIVFMGSAEISCGILESLLQAPNDEVVGVVTQPDRPCGRRLQNTPCPCRALADRRGVPVICPGKVNDPGVLDAIAAWAPDVAVVAAYGQFLGRRLLALPRLGCINVHLSLLPRFRGAAPIQWAIASGDARTGVTIMLMDEGMDSGDILMQAVEPIRPDDTAGTLQERLALLGARVLRDALPRWVSGDLPRIPQDPRLVVGAPKLHKSDGLIDWTAAAAVIDRRVRAFDPWPSCYTWLPARVDSRAGASRLKVLRVEPLAGAAPGAGLPPGAICEVGRGVEPLVRTGDGAVRLLDVQPEGGKRMSGQALACGYRLQVGEMLGIGHG